MKICLNMEKDVESVTVQEKKPCFSFDMKLGNTYIGIGTAASTYPCAWCELPKKDFNNTYISGKMRTLGQIRKKC